MTEGGDAGTGKGAVTELHRPPQLLPSPVAFLSARLRTTDFQVVWYLEAMARYLGRIRFFVSSLSVFLNCTLQ